MKLEGKTYYAQLRQLGSSRTKKATLRRVLILPGTAFTVLRCRKCGHEVYLEAHHRYGTGKLRPIYRKGYKRPKKWSGKCPVQKMNAFREYYGKPCGSKDWDYVRTEVMDHGIHSKLYAEVSGG